MNNHLDHPITCRTWQICSPDLALLNLFLWETLKATVYQDIPTTPENMWQHIIDKCDALNPQVIERSRQTLIK
jgi:hypothetical protein